MPQELQERPEAVAIVGMAGRFPGAPDIDTLWRRLCAGEECLTRLTEEQMRAGGVPEHLIHNPAYVPTVGLLDDIEFFDADFFRVTPREAAITDPQHRLMLEIAWHALEHAGIVPSITNGSIGVFAGCGRSSYLLHHLLPQRSSLSDVGELRVRMGNSVEYLATRLAYKLNLTGPALSIGTACSTSLVAVHTACDNLLGFQCDVALAGGISIQLPQQAGYLYQEGGILSPDGHCRAFDADAHGTVSGNGGALVVLKRLSTAVADGSRIYAVIRGSAINNDGSDKPGFTAPSLTAQTRAITEALAISGVRADAIGYVETHGTGTPIGDPIEFAALSAAFSTQTRRRQFCAIGSVKTNLGHLDEAAGVTGLIKAVLCLHHGIIPPSLHFQRPNPELAYAASPFFVNSKLLSWECGINGSLRAAGVSSFGIGGTNVHLVLEQAPQPAKTSASSAPFQLLPLSAQSADALDRNRMRLADFFERPDHPSLADAAHTLQTRRVELSFRTFAVAARAADASASLRLAASRGRHKCDSREPAVILLLPGQGSQRVGMLAGLWEHQPIFRKWLECCASALDRLGFERNLIELLYPSTEEALLHHEAELLRTDFAQPALFAVEYAVAQLWEHWGVRFSAMIGHSLGEFVAACMCGAMDLDTALGVVVARGKCMHASPRGSMLAVPLAATEAETFLLPGLAISARNAPDRCVVAGPQHAIEKLEARLQLNGLPSQRLRVEHAFHTVAMDTAAQSFLEVMQRVKLQIPASLWISNVTGDWITAADAIDPHYYVRHLSAPVEFGQGIERLGSSFGGAIFLEAGPGATLTRLARRSLSGNEGFVASNPISAGQHDLEAMLTAAGELWTRGVRLDWANLGEPGRQCVPLRAYSFERSRFWLNAPSGAESADTGPRTADVKDWCYAPSWTRTLQPTQPAAGPRTWLVFMDRSDASEGLVRELEASGDVVRVHAGDHWYQATPNLFTIRPGHAGDVQSLVQTILPRSAHPLSIVHLWHRERHPELAAALNHGFYTLLFLVQGLVRSKRESFALMIVSTDTHQVTGQESLDAGKRTLVGLLQVLRQEFPMVAVSQLDLLATDPWDHPAARAVAVHLRSSSTEPILSMRGRFLWKPTFEIAPPLPAPSLLRTQGVYLITGGLGTLGRILSQYLAERFQPTLLLVGRSPVMANDPVTEQHLQRLAELGVTFEYLQADVADPSMMENVVSFAEVRFGRIDGVFHLAAVPAARSAIPLEDLTREQCQEHFDVKAKGLQVLLEILQPRRPDFLVLFSSLSTILGGIGFAAYSAANHYLDSSAESIRDSAVPRTISISFDGWQQEGASGDFITPSEAPALFDQLFRTSTPSHVIVSATPLAARRQRWASAAPLPVSLATTSSKSVSIAQRLRRLWCEVLAVPNVEPGRSFFGMYGDSLQATQLLARINLEFGASIRLKDFLAEPTITGLGRLLALPTQQGTQILPAPPSADYPLTSNQQRLWILCQDREASLAYNMSYAIRLGGPLDSNVLARSFGWVVARHEILRTAFITVESTPRQVVLPAVPFTLPVQQMESGCDAEAYTKAEIEREAATPFPLDTPPLLRARLLKLDTNEAVLIVTLHHIIADGDTLNTLIEELTVCYAGFWGEKTPALPALPIQFKDFAVWQRAQLSGPRLQLLRNYWMGHLGGEWPTLDLPYDPPAGSDATNRTTITLAPGELASLHEVAALRSATLFALLTAVVKVMLHTQTGQANILIGTPMSGRERPELQGQMGYYLNNVLLFDTVRRREPFLDLLERVQQTITGALGHQEYPLDLLAQDLSVPVVDGRLRLFNVQINLMPAAGAALAFGGAQLTALPVPSAVPLFDLNFMFGESEQGLTMELEYDARRFQRSRVENMADHLFLMLRSIAAQPEQTVRTLCALGTEPEPRAGEMPLQVSGAARERD